MDGLEEMGYGIWVDWRRWDMGYGWIGGDGYGIWEEGNNEDM